MNEFTRAYIKTALWSSLDNDDEPMDRNYSIDDLAPETLEAMKADCATFQAENATDLIEANCLYYTGDWEARAGHDFWITCSGHGCGFWDGDWTEGAGERLTKACHKLGEPFLYLGDDGLIYHYCNSPKITG